MRELSLASELRNYRATEEVYAVGAAADHLYVVVEGRFRLHAPSKEAQGVTLRSVGELGTFGEESMVLQLGTRASAASCELAGVLLLVPSALYQRVRERATAGHDRAASVEAAVAQSLAADLLAGTRLGAGLGGSERAGLVRESVQVCLGRGDEVYGIGDRADAVYVVLSGMVQIQSYDDEISAPEICAHLRRGDLFGDDELAGAGRRRTAAVAQGPSWLLKMPGAVWSEYLRRHPDRSAETLRRVDTSLVGLAPSRGTTAQLMRDRYRLSVARSLLVIDQDSCVRCGHCAWACASVHQDGVSRLVREGDKLVLSAGGEARALLVPSSCQHCKVATCMQDCPTGAIGRSAKGEIVIREDLCIGCGNCARGCPWDNIQMVLPKGRAQPLATKCDLCADRPEGPACVSACPTAAVVRLDPEAALGDLTQSRVEGDAALLPQRRPMAPFAAAGALAGAVSLLAPLGPRPAGLLALALVLALGAYSVLKRALLPRGRLGPAWLHYGLHLGLGTTLPFLLLAHARARTFVPWAQAAGYATLLAVVLGFAVAAAYALLPRMLGRLDRHPLLPEGMGERIERLRRELFTALSGRSAPVKALYQTMLGPYARSVVLGPVFLGLSGRSVEAERRRVGSQAQALLGGEGGERGDANPGTPEPQRLAGLSKVVSLVVDLRAQIAVARGTGVLRVLPTLHVAMAALALAATIAHVAYAVHPW